MNHEQAQQLVMQVSLPMLVRGHAIQTRVMDDILSIRVPNLYRVTLGLPCSVLENSTTSYFDCKVRKLILVMPIRRIEEVIEVIEEPVKEVRPKVSLPARVVSDDSAGKRPLIEEISSEPAEGETTDDLLFDVV